MAGWASFAMRGGADVSRAGRRKARGDAPMVATVAEDHGLLVARSAAVLAVLIDGLLLQLLRHLLETLLGW